MSKPKLRYEIQTCVIGAGVIGLAVARALVKVGKEVLILERNSNIGAETSSRNSEVIHAGIYYPPSYLKAQLCVKGIELLYQYCKSRYIPFDRKGKLIVATNESQMKFELPKILDNAIQSRVNDLILLSNQDVKQNFETEVTCHGALFSPSTGVIDSHSYMMSLLADIEEGGGTLALNSRVDNVKVLGDKKLQIDTEEMELVCESVVNCAGLKAGDISNMVFTSVRNSDGTNHQGKISNCDEILHHRQQYFAKGNYFRLQGQKSPFTHLVYPVPEKGGLGVHATIDLVGNTRFGPDVEWVNEDVVNPDDIDLSVNPTRSDCFYDEVRKYWPGLKDGSLVPDYCGIRPKLGHPLQNNGISLKADFYIQTELDHGVKGFVNLLGMESPGLTSSLAVAELIKAKLLDHNC